MDVDEGNYTYDGNDFLEVLEQQRNAAMTQVAQLSAVIATMKKENEKLQSQILQAQIQQSQSAHKPASLPSLDDEVAGGEGSGDDL